MSDNLQIPPDRSSAVLPAFSTHDTPNLALSYGVLYRQLRDARATISLRSHCEDLCLGKSGTPIAFAAQRLVPSLGVSVVGINKIRPEKKMAGSDAGWRIATMQDQKSIGNLAICDRPHETGGQDILHGAPFSSHAESSVTMALGSRPIPTAIIQHDALQKPAKHFRIRRRRNMDSHE